MQKASKAYKQAMKLPFLNNGYIRVRIGIINSQAQENVSVADARNDFTYFSDARKPFEAYDVTKVYATSENDFSKVDGNMYFLPEESGEFDYYNNGIVTNALLGTVYIFFGGLTGFDIKGLTIDFGECYPTEFTVESDSGTHSYTNDKRIFVTEDVFDGTSFFVIRPTKMVNEHGRLRIFQFECGITNTFTNENVKNYSLKDYVSSITETIPSQDVSITVDNQSLYYSVDNPESALAYMEVGQEVKTAFGYDVTGNGDIEWMPEITTYLKTWASNDVDVKFTATDRFDYITGTYYRGMYRSTGISLYDLAVDVLNDAGITDSREYFLDPYLKGIISYNPLPPVKHSQALQIIANAGRCTLYEDRQSRIHMQASFVPDMVAFANNETEYSKIENVLVDDVKDAYAITSNDFSVTDGSTLFMPSNMHYLNTGYVSKSIWVKPPDGTITRRLGFRLGTSIKELYSGGYWDREEPKITIQLEAAFVAFGVLIRFRNVAPQEFHIVTYYNEIMVADMVVSNPDLEYVTHDRFDLFDKMELIFTKGYPNSRIVIDNILIGDVTDYRLNWKTDLQSSPTRTRQQKIKSISVKRMLYSQNTEITDLISEELSVPYDNYEYTVYFLNPSYDLAALVEDNKSIICEILDSSNYFAKVRFSGITAENSVVKFKITGREYIVKEQFLTVPHNENGQEKEWSNPLISTAEHAKDLEEWLATYYLGDVDYSYKWRGDPRIDANDLFYLDLKERESVLVREYEHTLKFNGAWSCTSKARKAVVKWR